MALFAGHWSFWRTLLLKFRIIASWFVGTTDYIFLASFSDVTAIIFVVACSSYNLVLREDPSQVSGAAWGYSLKLTLLGRNWAVVPLSLCTCLFHPFSDKNIEKNKNPGRDIKGKISAHYCCCTLMFILCLHQVLT